MGGMQFRTLKLLVKAHGGTRQAAAHLFTILFFICWKREKNQILVTLVDQ